MLHGKAVPPNGVSPSGHEASDRGAVIGRLIMSLSHPMLDLGTIGRIHPTHFMGPGLFEAVLQLCEMSFALGILTSAANIQGETEFLV